MKLSPACCRCCRESLKIAADHAREGGPRAPWRLPRHGCLCGGQLPDDRCGCAWCREVLAFGPRCARQGCEDPARYGGLCRVHHDLKRDRDRAAAARSREVRQPPALPFADVAGACSLCGTTPLPPRRRSWCGDECVALWNIATSGRVALHHLSQLHGWACWRCGVEEWTEEREAFGSFPARTVSHRVDLFVDHARPLWSLSPEERGQLRWWLPYNLQLLCGTCHGAKTSHEAKVRAAWRRGERMPLELPGGGQLALGV